MRIAADDIQVNRAHMAALLLAFRLEETRDDISLDIIEMIALHMSQREDINVFELGIFVRANLACFELGTLSFPDIHARFMAALLAAPLGPAAFSETLHIGSRGCHL